MFFIFIEKVSVFIVIIHGIDVVIWANKSDLTYSRFMYYKVGFGEPEFVVSIFLLQSLGLD